MLNHVFNKLKFEGEISFINWNFRFFRKFFLLTFFRKAPFANFKGLHSIICPSLIEMSKIIETNTESNTIGGKLGYDSGVSAYVEGNHVGGSQRNIEFAVLKDPSFIDFSKNLERVADTMTLQVKDRKIVLLIDEAQVNSLNLPDFLQLKNIRFWGDLKI